MPIVLLDTTVGTPPEGGNWILRCFGTHKQEPDREAGSEVEPNTYHFVVVWQFPATVLVEATDHEDIDMWCLSDMSRLTRTLTLVIIMTPILGP